LSLDKAITYLEMTSLGGLCAAPVVPGLALLHIDCCSPLLRSMPTRVGEAYSWPGASRTQDEWDSEILAHPLREYWLITQVTHERDAAGVAYLEPQPGGNVEIVAFGLLPEYVGKGLGGYALTLALRQAWAVESVGFEAVRRVWLHTSSDDHPMRCATTRSAACAVSQRSPVREGADRS
jgi:RimJ/RimL family protein N-acetyltransferase